MAKILLDTHALLWWLAGDDRLPTASREQIEDPGNRVLASAVNAWEVSIKRALGKLQAPNDLLETGTEAGLEWIPVTPEEAYLAGCLPMHHRDPFDRLLIAQARTRQLTLLSRDRALDRYGIDRSWA